jgi:MFS transporter, PHS family, inorganic phosphate transporter
VAAKADTMNALQEMSKIAHTQMVVTLCGTIPGYWYTIFIDIMEQFAIPSSSLAYSASHGGIHAQSFHIVPPLVHVGFIVMYAFTFSPSSLPTLKWPDWRGLSRIKSYTNKKFTQLSQ